MSEWDDVNHMNSRRRQKRLARRLPESSSDRDSDSDISVVRSVKRRKVRRVVSDSSSSSSSSSTFRTKVSRRVVRRVMSNSDDGSDSNSSVVQPRRRRKVPRVLNEAQSSSESSSSDEELDRTAEDEESEESGLHSSSDSEESDVSSSEYSDNSDWQGEWSSDKDEDLQQALAESLATSKPTMSSKKKESDECQTSPKAVAASSAGFMSDSSDGESEKCPICLLRFTTQEVGTPESCDHSFCVTCLEEWAKNMSTCPVDRISFAWILVRRSLQGKVIRKIPVETRRLDDGSPEDDPDPTYCEVCGRSDREDRLLLCDGCDLGYHLECLDPPMETVPVEEWFCQDCANNSRIAEEVDFQENELMDLLDDAGDVPLRPRTSRLLPRTRQSERVRATIMSRHERTTEPAMQPSTSGIDSLDTESTPSSYSRSRRSTTTTTRKRRKAVRRTTRKRRRKTTSKASSKQKTKSTSKITSTKVSSSKRGSGTFRKPRRRTKKRKSRRRKLKVSRRRVARVVMPLSVKGRLAEQLGMCPPTRPGATLPVVRARPASDIDALRSRAGIPALHIFGIRDQLDYFSGSDNEGANQETSVAVLPRRPVYSARSLASRKALSVLAVRSRTPASRTQRRANVLAAQQSEDKVSNNPCDVLGSIMDSQSIWHSNKTDVTISRDGNLEVKKGSSDILKSNTESSNSGGGSIKSDDKSLIKSGNNSSVPDSSSQQCDVRNALGETRQAPLYPGRDGSSGSRPSSSGSGFHQFGGNRYGSSSSSSSSNSYQNYQSGRGYSNFSSTSSFDSHSTRTGYSNYLNNPPPPPPLQFRGSPMRFRLAPRFPLRRPQAPPPPPRLPVPPIKKEKVKVEESAEVNKKPQDEEEDEIDIYSDIEMGGVGSGGPSGGGSEPDEAERNMDVSYEALPPPPEPSALLMGLGEQVLSDDEQASDSELVIDDNVAPSSPQDQNDSMTQVPDSEKYDPAEPSYDSDEDLPVTSSSAAVSKDIPLPSVPIVSSTSPHSTSMSQHIMNSSSNSSMSYLHSPTYGDKPSSESGTKLSTAATEGVVQQVVKEVLKEHLKRQTMSADADEEDDDECPNFSIYSALSMDIARKTAEEKIDEVNNEEEKEPEKVDDDETIEKEPEKINKFPDVEEKDDPDTTMASEESEQHTLQEEQDDKDDKHSKESDVENNMSDVECVGKDTHPPSDVEEHLTKDDVESGEVGEISGNEQLENDKETPCETIPAEAALIEQEKKCDDPALGDEVKDHEQHDGSGEPPELPLVDVSTADDKPKDQELVEEIFGSDDNDSLIGGATSAVSAATMDNNPPLSTPIGLEGLDTETISETEETINFDDDISQDGNEFLTAEEDGEIPSHKKKKKKKSRKVGGSSSKDVGDLGDLELSPAEVIDYEEGEIVDDRPNKSQELSKKEKKLSEKKEKTKRNDEGRRSPNENVDISSSKSMEEEKKKKKKKSNEKGGVQRDRAVLGSSENKEKNRDKSRRSEENISWKKPSKSTKGRNYRDGKSGKTDDSVAKDKDRDSGSKEVGKKEKKKKEKRKDMERYDVRKVVSDKKRKRRDEFGRDLSRDRSISHSRSRSRRRSRDRSRQRSGSLSRTKRNRSRGRSPVKARGNRSRSRSRVRTRSRSRVRSRSRSRNRSSRRSRERVRKSRSKDRIRSRVSRSHSRSKRSRTRSRSRSKNRQRARSRSRSIVRSRERKDRTHNIKDSQRFHVRRSWSHTWTPSWSRSRSRSISCSSYSHSRSPSVRHYNHSYTRSFSRSWSRERHERIPVLEKKTLSKTQKKLTVIVNNTKDDTERQRKKDKKRKENRKNKEGTGTVEKRKKRKEKSPAPSKEVFTSGDNILVSVNFNKSNKTSTVKDTSSASLTALPKETSKRKRDGTFEGDVEPVKKTRKGKVMKEKGSPRLKGGAPTEKAALRSVSEKKSKKQAAKANKSARMAAILKQKPVAIIDLDQSPFHEQTPSPTDLIVLSDSDETGNKNGEMDELIESLTGRRGMRATSPSPPTSSKIVHNVATTRTPESQSPLMSAISNYLITSTGPKTPPEPQVKFSIVPKPQLRTINNPLMEEEDDRLTDPTGLEDSDQRIDEELDGGLVDIVHKGPNTPPEPRGPTTPCSPPTSPDAYDPFDPTKSGTPSPAGPEASMDGPPSPTGTPTDELLQRVGGAVAAAAGGTGSGGAGRDSALATELEDLVNKSIEPRTKSPTLLSGEEITEERSQSPDRTKPVLTKSPSGIPENSVTLQLPSDDLSQSVDLSDSLDKTKTKPAVVVSESSAISPERKISVVITTQTAKMQGTPVKQQLFPTPGIKQIPVSQQNATSTPNHSNAPAPLFPTLTPANIASILCTPPTNLNLSRANIFSTPTPVAVPPLLQHMANSPVVPATQKTPVRLPSDKQSSSGVPLRSMVQNGEQQKQPPDTSTEVVDMDLDSPYSPGSSEGDDLFDPPVENSKANQQSYSSDRSRTTQQNSKTSSKILGLPLVPLPTHKSPSKPAHDKFDSIFGVSPLRPNKLGAANRSASHQNKSHHKISKVKTAKHVKGGRKEIAIKMDEDQLQILDDLPSSAVELQVKDKFLKKLNRQERVVEEVKLSLKPHYAKKHVTKEEYKDILRKSVPKICHNKSGEINPVKISSLVEAYVKKYRYAKKKNTSGTNVTPSKPKPARPSKWS